MQIDIITIFPQIFNLIDVGVLGKAHAKQILQFEIHNLRNWAVGKHKSVDDTPYGGGPGMIMKPDVWTWAIEAVSNSSATIIFPSPSGIKFSQPLAKNLATKSQLVFCCGRYEGIDARVIELAEKQFETLEVSIGDYVLIGGESAAWVMIEAITRLIPGVLGNELSAANDSFAAGNLLEGSQYTRPKIWRGLEVPQVLQEGNHAKIAEFRQQQSRLKTQKNRPDLLKE